MRNWTCITNCIPFLIWPVSSRASDSEVPSRISAPETIDDIIDKKQCYGIFGIVDLVETKYIITIDSCTLIGNLLNSPIFRIDSVSFCRVGKNVSKSAGTRNANCISMMKQAIEDKSMYFSRDFSLTLSAQSILDKIASGVIKAGNPMSCLYSEDRFFVNKKHCQVFYENRMYEMIIPVIHGFVDVLLLFTCDSKPI